uniref:Uncharacterized protein n=1 Tax=Chromera velia CCMP2878 TaxID=1169474 RepID=A0A0G4IC65_9ALVE|eukprot:Cvel_2253.t1-p1 / transcript=Cvel_2253.t1 / gene=Cvel_2253 / organism=Chromera_velia_CCMP2878 / gene_product=hypothetical protein / transcript_product=hypothetical protein / location=Cvel_scaffold87:33134-33571(+) / protein_length=146 / sequence_SO=supercontig / SO=protein_coding / is_pseudo=false
MFVQLAERWKRAKELNRQLQNAQRRLQAPAVRSLDSEGGGGERRVEGDGDEEMGGGGVALEGESEGEEMRVERGRDEAAFGGSKGEGREKKVEGDGDEKMGGGGVALDEEGEGEEMRIEREGEEELKESKLNSPRRLTIHFAPLKL